MRYRLLATDVDGTLLDPAGQVRPAVRQALRAAVAAGCAVTLATGRSMAFVRPLAAELSLNLPVILHSGALIRTVTTSEVLYARTVDRATAAEVIGAVRRHQHQPLVFQNPQAGEGVFTGIEAWDNAPTRRYLGTKAALTHRSEFPLPPDGLDPLSLAVLGEAAELAPIAAELAHLPGCRPVLNLLPTTQSHVLDILGPGCSKASALEFLAARLGIPMAAVIAVGDHFNDLEMLAAAGFGVAMGNAPPAVQAEAAWIAPANAADGLAAVIHRFILDREPELNTEAQRTGRRHRDDSRKSP